MWNSIDRFILYTTMLLTHRFSYLSLAIIYHLIVFAVQQGSTERFQNNNLETNNNIDGVGMESLNENDFRCNCSCGLPNSKNSRSRIVNGTITSKNQFPWMVHIRITYKYGKLSGTTVFVCGGTLINDRYVLTAAHCVRSKKKVQPTVMVRLRIQNRCKKDEENTLTRHVTDIIMEKSTTNNHDIALLKLNKAVPITEHTIRPICLPNDTDVYRADDMLTVIGWGNDRENGTASCELMRVDLPVFDHNECTKIYPNINDGEICAGYKEGGKDSCQGDSGGPLMKMTHSGRYTIAGIVSYGYGCARPNIPGIYTRVNKYTRFIRENTKDGCFCSQ